MPSTWTSDSYWVKQQPETDAIHKSAGDFYDSLVLSFTRVAVSTDASFFA